MYKHPTLFITHRGLFHQQAALEAAPANLEVTMLRTPTKEQILALLPGKEFLISERSGVIDAEMIQTGQDLRLIQRLGSQTQDIDLDVAKAAGIPVCYLPIRTCINVSEHMIMQILSLARRLREMVEVTLSAEDFGQEPTRCTEDTFAYNWSGREDIHSIWQSTVGILGMGEIGFELARRLKGFDCKVLYNKRHPLPAHTERELNVQYASCDELVASSDFVCILLPLLPETAQSMNREFFAKMKPGACFVSSGGSGVIDEAALAEALQSGRLYGAAVDNFTWEPIRKDCALLEPARKPGANVILTPHTAAGTVPSSNIGLRSEDFKNITHLLINEKLEYRLV
ncbi:MAG TPA: NAD(P)-dependent oxidoreductase [Anaerolineaceae bacterium]|nr:NAD(P)-dependent oxidoreductase [Anaerolineaceae bacterium]